MPRYTLQAGLTLLVGQRQSGSIPLEVSVDGVNVFMLRPMTCLRGDRPQGRFMPHLWWYIMLVRVWCQRAGAYR